MHKNKLNRRVSNQRVACRSLSQQVFLAASFLILGIINISCDEEELISGKIKRVHTYNDNNEIVKTEFYEYDEAGNLTKEIVSREDRSDYFREFAYDDDDNNLIQVVDQWDTTNFLYNSTGQLEYISTRNSGTSFEYEGDHVQPAGGYFYFNYDDHQNITSITNSDKSMWYMAKGSYEYDNSNYIYTSWPIALRLYYALYRSEFVTSTTNLFRFNIGANNVVRNNLYDDSGEIASYYLFNYQYNDQGFPTALSMESHSFDGNGNDYLGSTYKYSFEYY